MWIQTVVALKPHFHHGDVSIFKNSHAKRWQLWRLSVRSHRNRNLELWFRHLASQMCRPLDPKDGLRGFGFSRVTELHSCNSAFNSCLEGFALPKSLSVCLEDGCLFIVSGRRSNVALFPSIWGFVSIYSATLKSTSWKEVGGQGGIFLETEKGRRGWKSGVRGRVW